MIKKNEIYKLEVTGEDLFWLYILLGNSSVPSTNPAGKQGLFMRVAGMVSNQQEIILDKLSFPLIDLREDNLYQGLEDVFAEAQEEKQKDGHMLADGSYSSEYEEGDYFVVLEDGIGFDEGSIVCLYDIDTYYRNGPLCKLVSGHTEYDHAGGEKGAWENWDKLEPLTAVEKEILLIKQDFDAKFESIMEKYK